MKLSDRIIEAGPYEERLDAIRAAMGVGADAAALNELREELIAARKLRALLDGPYLIYATPVPRDDSAMVGISHDGCPAQWYAEVEDFAELKDLVQRAREHAEVCG